MTRMSKRLCLAMLAMAAAAPVFAQAPQYDVPPQPVSRLESDPVLARVHAQWVARHRVALETHLRTVAARATPRDLLVAGLLWPPDEQAEAEGDFPARQSAVWLQAAYDAQPRDVLVDWTLLDACLWRGVTCDRDALLQGLLKADAGNAELQLRGMSDALRQGDSAQADMYWQAAVRAPRYHERAGEIGRLLQDTLRSVPAPPLDPRVAAAMGEDLRLGRPATAGDIADIGSLGLIMAIAVPTLQPVTERCKPVGGRLSPTRLDECRTVLTRITDDQSLLITQIIALPSLMELPSSAVEQTALRERLRRLAWVSENATPGQEGRPGWTVPADYAMRFMRDGELPAMRYLLQANGIALEPPAGWLPQTPHWRNLILTGSTSGA